MLSGIVLAAGNSSRMGRPKALLEYKGEIFLEIICRKLEKLDLDKTVVVLGKDRDAVLGKWTPRKEEVVFNDKPGLGQIHSLRLALGKIDENSSFLVCLADQPLIKPETYGAVSDFWLKNPDFIIIPSYHRDAAHSQDARLKSQDSEGIAPDPTLYTLNPIPCFKRGHPIIIPALYRELCFNGPIDEGLHWVTHHGSAKVKDLETEDRGILRDFDTPEEYKNIEAF